MSERSEHGTSQHHDAQLRLLPGGERRRGDWVLDERTRRLGRHGVATARETLRRAQPPEPVQSPAARKAS